MTKSCEIRFALDGFLYSCAIGKLDIFLTAAITNTPKPGSKVLIPCAPAYQELPTCTLTMESHRTYPDPKPKKIIVVLSVDQKTAANSKSTTFGRDYDYDGSSIGGFVDDVSILTATCEAYKNMLLASDSNLHAFMQSQKQQISEWINLQTDFEQYRKDNCARRIQDAAEIKRLADALTTCRSDRDTFVKLSCSLTRELKSMNKECSELRAAMIRLMRERDASKSECEAARALKSKAIN